MKEVNFSEGCSCVYPKAKILTSAAFDELLRAANEQLMQAKEGLARATDKGLNDLVEVYKDSLPKIEEVIKEIESVKTNFDKIPVCKK